MNQVELSVLLPTRGRTSLLKQSIMSLVDQSFDPANIEYLLGFDLDDSESSSWFLENIAPLIDQAGSVYTCLGFQRYGYQQLHKYVNGLAEKSSGRWLMFWNDDAEMKTPGWDRIILQEQGFNVLRMPTHNCHPYAIFPVVPRQWHTIVGSLSQHQLTDAWISQIGYLLDIVKNIPVEVEHLRSDLTGNSSDETYQSRVIFEGRLEDPRDFHYHKCQHRRYSDAIKLANFLKSKGQDMSWFERVIAGKQDPWEKMRSPEYDPNNQLGEILPKESKK